MNKRLQQFLAAENISQSQLADTLGVARASVSHIVAGRNKPGFDFLERMARHYPDLSLEWLVSGRGKMYNNSAKTAPDAPVGPISPFTNDTENELSFPKETAPTTSFIDSDNSEQLAINQKSISKIIIFYTDGSFQELP